MNTLRDGLSVDELARATSRPTRVARKRAWSAVADNKMTAGFRPEKGGYQRIFRKVNGDPAPVVPNVQAQYGQNLHSLLGFWAYAMKDDRRQIWLATNMSMSPWLSGRGEWTEDAGMAVRVAALDACIMDLPSYCQDALWFEYGLTDIYRHDLSPVVGLAKAMHFLALLAKLRVSGL